MANNARGDMERDMRFTGLNRRLDRPLRACAAGIALLAVLTGCGRGDAKSSKQAPAAPTQTVIVTEVAQRVGYSNPSKFAAAFRRRFGMSPSAL